MIDIEACGVDPDACILTIAVQNFEPLKTVDYNVLSNLYLKINIDSQANRSVNQSTIEWWATQPASAKAEAFEGDDRIDLDEALTKLTKQLWHCKHIWANGPTYDMTILEHAYKSYNMALPWRYFNVRDARTIYSLCPSLEKYPATHHALEDCRRQIDLLQDCFEMLHIKGLK